MMQSLPPKKRAKVAKKLKAKDKQVIIHKNTTQKVIKEAKGNDNNSSKSSKKVGKNSSGGIKAKYLSMVVECIFKQQNKNGSSRPVILNQLKLDFGDVIGSNEKNINLNLKLALKQGLENGVLKMAKEAGKGSGSFKLTNDELKKLKTKYPQKKAVKKTDSIPSLSEDTIIKTPESFVLLEKVPPEVMSSSLSSPSLRRRSSIAS